VNENGKIYGKSEIEEQKRIDGELIGRSWERLKAKLSATVPKGICREITKSLKDLVSIYTDRAIDWYAKLYDPRIGGFYYSNSARDNKTVDCEGATYELLPDLESTKQALSVVNNSHMADKYGKSAVAALPEWMKERTVPFIRNMQNPENGYFYHPQWGRERTDKWENRRGRDLKWAVSLLKDFGEAPLYPTPLDGVSEKKDKKHITASAHLESRESFIEYLNSLGYDPKNAYSAYVIGNKLESQAAEIKARDTELEKMGAGYRLGEALKEWFDERFNSENGSWTTSPLCLDTCNGILKISSTYVRCGVPLPDPIASVKTVIQCITLDERPEHVCCVLNTWYALNTLIGGVRQSSSYGSSVSDTMEAIRREVIGSYPEMVRRTAENLMLFRKPDGSFSYFQGRSSHYSQMMPVAIPNTDEGDMNASMICNINIPNHIFNYLDCGGIPIYTEADRMRFVSILEENKRKA